MNFIRKHAARFVLGAFGVLTILACFGGPSKISAKSLAVSPPSLMIARKVQRPAYILVDPAKIPSSMAILVDGASRGGTLTDVQEFATRDLKKAFSNYFEKVEVVRPGWTPPSTPHVLVDARVERVEVRMAGHSGGVGYGSAVLTWGLGMRVSESDDYLFAFAGDSASSPGGDPNLIFRGMFESAIADMLKGYTDKEVHSQLLKIPATEERPNTTTM